MHSFTAEFNLSCIHSLMHSSIIAIINLAYLLPHLFSHLLYHLLSHLLYHPLSHLLPYLLYHLLCDCWHERQDTRRRSLLVKMKEHVIINHAYSLGPNDMAEHVDLFEYLSRISEYLNIRRAINLNYSWVSYLHWKKQRTRDQAINSSWILSTCLINYSNMAFQLPFHSFFLSFVHSFIVVVVNWWRHNIIFGTLNSFYLLIFCGLHFHDNVMKLCLNVVIVAMKYDAL